METADPAARGTLWISETPKHTEYQNLLWTGVRSPDTTWPSIHDPRQEML
jgi:hypothetical protein